MAGDRAAAIDVDAYLARIDYAGERSATPSVLADLHRSHLDAVPFENLDIRLGRALSLEPADLFDKIVTNRRGGFCYELSGLFALLLRELGFNVELYPARVVNKERELGPDRDHLALGVHCGGHWLADVGFGDAITWPLAIGAETARQLGSYFRAIKQDGGHWFASSENGIDFKDEYMFETMPLELGDFDEMCRYHQSSPKSHFTKKVVCSGPTASGRVTLSGRSLIETDADGRMVTTIATVAQYGDVLSSCFGVELESDDVATLFEKSGKSQ